MYAVAVNILTLGLLLYGLLGMHPPYPVNEGDAMIIYRAAFPLGDFVLVHLSSLLIHELLFQLKHDGGAI